MGIILLIIGTSGATYSVIRLFDGHKEYKRRQKLIERMKESALELKEGIKEIKTVIKENRIKMEGMNNEK